MNNLKQRACCLLVRAAVLLAPLAAHGTEIVVAGQSALQAGDGPGTGSVLMLVAGLVVVGCMRGGGHGAGEFEA